MTLAVCDGRGGRGGRMAGLLLQAATKEQWAAPGPRGDRPRGWELAGPCPWGELASCWHRREGRGEKAVPNPNQN